MLVLIVLLVIFGLAVLFSSSEYNGRVRFGDSACYFKKQLFATALGMGVMYMVSSIDYHFFLRLGPVAYLISMFLSGAVLFVGQEINGSKRWLNLGPLCEEMGAAGAIFLIFLFAMLLWRLGVAAMHAKDLAGALICCGIMGHLALQVILNIAVVTNTIPNTGITLPFISYGGTSAVFLLGEMGLAMNVGKCDRIN